MNQEQKELLREKIKSALSEFEQKIKDLELAAAPIGPENAIGRVSRMDAINNKSVVEAALRNAKRKYGKLQMALKAVDKPDFGICSKCKRPIPAARLMFLPESTHCVNCAK